jgi:SAM-dependent methyltransferase
MVKVLQGWQEIGDSILALQSKGLPTHATAQKNWDHFLLSTSLASADRDSLIVDLGCGDGHTLALLHALGFSNVHGIDFQIDWKPRARQLLTMWREKSLRPPFHLHRGDITKTHFQPESFDAAISISTIEHGVDIKIFLAEAQRILKPGGLLFVTTDYWEEKITTDSAARVYGLPWQIFCRDQIEAMITAAGEFGLTLSEQTAIPICSERPVFWQNSNYTFIALLFKKARA